MIRLTGKNLCERQHDLNRQVNEAFSNNIHFDNIKDSTETSDVDRLLKIDLAAKYKNIVYILETFKSGDDLYISRALKKCSWLYSDEYSNVINTDHLHHNVFPLMSTKMKNKFLYNIATHLTNENRAADFYNYCDIRKSTIAADKFLIKTSEEFKLNLVKNGTINSDIKYLKSFIGDSFALLETFLDKQNEFRRFNIILQFQHMFVISSSKFLDLLEKYAMDGVHKPKGLGLRISKNIMTKHKGRVLTNPKFYINILSISKIVRHSKPEEAKIYIENLMPQKDNEFWKIYFYKTYKLIIDIIPIEERYAFIKKTFSDKYSGKEFETTEMFYNQNYYQLMSATETELWALQHIKSGRELLGPGCDYKWYKFVNFETAFIEIKKYIRISKDKTKRGDMLKVLVECTKNQEDLEKILNYYYVRHVNESKGQKENFLRNVISNHKIFELNDNCWIAFDKLLSSIDVYNTLGYGCDPEFKIISILYHILNGKELPDSLISYLENDMSCHSLRSVLNSLDDQKDKKQKVYDFIFNFYLSRIEQCNPSVECASDLEAIKTKVSTYICYILELMSVYKKTKTDIPEIVMKFVNLDKASYRYQQILEETDERVSQKKLLKLLRDDAALCVELLPEVKKFVCDRSTLKINTWLQKLKIYFANDIAQTYLKSFHDLLLEENLFTTVASVAVFGIFQLSNDNQKIEFMKKYAPENEKIDHSKVDRALLSIQESICRYACYSRPPVPLSEMLKFMKGDYVPYCLPIFNRYLSILPQPLFFEFVESILDAPVSIQKHGLRLAFKSYSADNLKTLIFNVWKKTKNTSLRSIIYKALLTKTAAEDSMELFEVLKKVTLDLHDEDDDELFSVIMTSNKLSRKFLGEYIEAIWTTVNKFSNKQINLCRKKMAISCIDQNIHLINKEIPKEIVNKFVNTLLEKPQLCADIEGGHLTSEMWNLVAHFLVYSTNSEMEQKDNVKLTKFIISHLLVNWNNVIDDVFISRRTFQDFIDRLIEKSYWDDESYYGNADPIFYAILEDLSAGLPLHEIYTMVWKLRLVIINRRIVERVRKLKKNEETKGNIAEFGKEIANLVKESVNDKMYYSHLTVSIKDIINECACKLCYGTEAGIKTDNILVAVALELVKLDIHEARLLALQLIPKNIDCFSANDDLKQVLKNIQDNADVEMQILYYNKFYGDCKRKRFV